jgi:ABC-2 type transport system ATP-binding protein
LHNPSFTTPRFSFSTNRPTVSTPTKNLKFGKLIKNLGKEKAILFSTHILEEVTAACTRAVIVDQGIIVADGTPKELEAQGGGSLYDLFHKVTTFETPAA